MGPGSLGQEVACNSRGTLIVVSIWPLLMGDCEAEGGPKIRGTIDLSDSNGSCGLKCSLLP